MQIAERPSTVDLLAAAAGIATPPESWRRHWAAFESWCESGGEPNVRWSVSSEAIEWFDLPHDVVTPLTDAMKTIAADDGLSRLGIFWHFLMYGLGPEIGDNSNAWLLPTELHGVNVKLFALAALVSGVGQALDNCNTRGMGDDVTRASLAFIGQRVREVNHKRGVWGIESFSFLRHYVRAELFRLGRLTFRVSPWPLSVEHPLIGLGDLRIEVHVAGGSRLDQAEVVDAYRQAMARLPGRHPGRKLVGFTCASWLLDPALNELIGSDSNICRFAEPYQLLPIIGDHRQAYDLIFGDAEVDPVRFNCTSKLQRAIAAYAARGGMIRSHTGFIPWDDAARLFAARAAEQRRTERKNTKNSGLTVAISTSIMLVIIALCSMASASDQPQSRWVSIGSAGKLVYRADPNGNHIPDFSNCGYGGGGVALPNAIVQDTIKPAAGDMTAFLQKAIDAVAKRPVGSDGLRGALLLTRGTYHINGTLRIAASGIVVRGEGQGDDGTVLVAEGTTKHNLIEIAGTGSRGYDNPHEATNIIDGYVPVGSKTFTVASAAHLHVGTTVWVDRPATAAWLADIGMDRIPPHRAAPDHDAEKVQPWDSSYHLRFDRIVTAINGQRVTVDAPLVNAFEKRYGGGTVYPYHYEGRIEHVGIENLRAISAFAGKPTDDDEKHGWIAIDLTKVQNAWVRDVTCVHFGFGLTNIGRDAKWVTVQDCSCLDPVSQITGGRRYSYNIQGELSLVQRCYSREGRHDFALDSRVPGPNVFLNCRAEHAHDDAGPHHRWSTGTLFDNVDTHIIDLQNRLNMGSGHGWAGANSVLWNCRVDEFKLQNPPTAQNWAIGTVGRQVLPSMMVGDEYRRRVPDDYFAAHPVPDPAWGFTADNRGIIDSPGAPVTPASLYLTQLRERLGDQAVKAIGYKE